MGVAEIEKEDWDEDIIKRADKTCIKLKEAGGTGWNRVT